MRLTALKPRVKQKLAERGLTQADLARRIGVSTVAISKVIRGLLISPYLKREIALLLREPEEPLWGDLYWFPRYRAARRAS